jgi:hypothetical protein
VTALVCKRFVELHYGTRCADGDRTGVQIVIEGLCVGDRISNYARKGKASSQRIRAAADNLCTTDPGQLRWIIPFKKSIERLKSINREPLIN